MLPAYRSLRPLRKPGERDLRFGFLDCKKGDNVTTRRQARINGGGRLPRPSDAGKPRFIQVADCAGASEVESTTSRGRVLVHKERALHGSGSRGRPTPRR